MLNMWSAHMQIGLCKGHIQMNRYAQWQHTQVLSHPAHTHTVVFHCAAHIHTHTQHILTKTKATQSLSLPEKHEQWDAKAAAFNSGH